MDLSGKRVSVSGEGRSCNGGGAGGSSNLQLVPYSESKKVCPFCQREFKCGRSLGGHIKVHKKNRRSTKFTHKKKSSTRRLRSSSALTTPTPLNVVRGDEMVAPLRILENGAALRTLEHGAEEALRIDESGARGAEEEALRIDESGGSGAEIHDMSKSLVGCGWKRKGRRGSNDDTSKLMRWNRYPYSDDDEYEECDVEDSCDEDDYDNIKLRKWLRSRGYATGAHKICWTRRMLMCKVCNQYFRTLSAVMSHVDECALTNSDDQVVVDNGVGVGEMPEDAPVTKDNGVSSSSSVQQKQHASTSTHAAAPTKDLQLDLNEMPPPEDD